MPHPNRSHKSRSSATSRPSHSRHEAAEPIADSTTPVGSDHELEIESAAHPGVFVGHIDGKAIFVPDTLPGEKVTVRITEDKARFARAELLDVVEASPDRVPHIWPEAEYTREPSQRVGGADYGHIGIRTQRTLKAQVLADALTRFAGLTAGEGILAKPVVVEPVQPTAGYRTRVGLHVDDAGRVGPLAARSHDVIRVATLPLAHPVLAELGEQTATRRGASRVDLVLPSRGEPLVIVDGGPRGSSRPTVTQLVRDHAFTVDATGFWQVHDRAAETLFGAVSSAVSKAVEAGIVGEDAPSLDLYGGVGLFGAALADLGLHVTSVEGNKRASQHAATNLRQWSQAQANGSSTEAFLGRAMQHPGSNRDRSVVVLDPPRSGAGLGVVERIVQYGPAMIVYVACDPVALARDAGSLRVRGYELRSLRAFDLFPQSHHLEALAVFVRA